MRYEVRYKTRPVVHGSWLFKRYNLFPMLSIRYRENGKGKWVSLGSADIDLYAFRRFRKTYYKDFRSGTMSVSALDVESDMTRLSVFMEILEKEYEGSLDNYVKFIVEEKLALDDADRAERDDVNCLTFLLTTKNTRSLFI